MDYKALHVIANFNKTPKTQICPIDLDNISWGHLSEHTLFCRFMLHEHKYIRVNYNSMPYSQYCKGWLTFKCEPDIYQKIESGEVVNLFEHNAEEYYKHEDYWCVNLQVEEPEGYTTYSIKVESLRYEYNIFVNVFKYDHNEFERLKRKMIEPLVIGHFYDPVTKEIDLQHDEYSSVVGAILNELQDEDEFEEVTNNE